MIVEMKTFLDKIHGLTPNYINFLGTAMPGMGGTAISTQGANSSGTDIMNTLRADATTFAKLYGDSASNEAIREAAQRIEGSLMTLQVLGQISDNTASALLDEMYDIVER